MKWEEGRTREGEGARHGRTWASNRLWNEVWQHVKGNPDMFPPCVRNKDREESGSRGQTDVAFPICRSLPTLGDESHLHEAVSSGDHACQVHRVVD